MVLVEHTNYKQLLYLFWIDWFMFWYFSIETSPRDRSSWETIQISDEARWAANASPSPCIGHSPGKWDLLFFISIIVWRLFYYVFEIVRKIWQATTTVSGVYIEYHNVLYQMTQDWRNGKRPFVCYIGSDLTWKPAMWRNNK